VSPAVKAKTKPPRRVVEEVVSGPDGEVGVRRETSGNVTVAWTCGDSAEFTPEQVREAIMYIEQFGVYDVWVSLRNNVGKAQFVARITGGLPNGNLVVGGDIVDAETGVPWEHLKAALEEALG